jgi:single-stranded DNA-binding protein
MSIQFLKCEAQGNLVADAKVVHFDKTNTDTVNARVVMDVGYMKDGAWVKRVEGINLRFMNGAVAHAKELVKGRHIWVEGDLRSYTTAEDGSRVWYLQVFRFRLDKKPLPKAEAAESKLPMPEVPADMIMPPGETVAGSVDPATIPFT